MSKKLKYLFPNLSTRGKRYDDIYLLEVKTSIDNNTGKIDYINSKNITQDITHSKTNFTSYIESLTPLKTKLKKIYVYDLNLVGWYIISHLKINNWKDVFLNGENIENINYKNLQFIDFSKIFPLKITNDNILEEMFGLINNLDEDGIDFKNFSSSIARTSFSSFKEELKNDDFIYESSLGYWSYFDLNNSDRDKRLNTWKEIRKGVKGGLVLNNSNYQFKITDGYYFDFKSNHPSIFNNSPLPYNKVYVGDELKKLEAKDGDKWYLYCVHFKHIKVKDGLPAILEKDIISNGEMTKKQITNEKNFIMYIDAIEFPYIEKFYDYKISSKKIVCGTRMRKINTQYFNKMFKLKEEAKNKYTKTLYKLMSVSIYGKFLQNSYYDKKLILSPDNFTIEKQKEKFFKRKEEFNKDGNFIKENIFISSEINDVITLNKGFNQLISYQKWEDNLIATTLGDINENATLSYLPVGIAITSYTRAKMYDLLLAYKKDVIYVAVDGIFFKNLPDINKDNYLICPHTQTPLFKIGKEIGNLDFKGYFEEGVFRGKNTYVIKNLSKGIERELNYKFVCSGLDVEHLNRLDNQIPLNEFTSPKMEIKGCKITKKFIDGGCKRERMDATLWGSNV